MQWFAAWADGSSLIKAEDWKDVRRVTAVNQPQLMGDRSYDIRYRGPSNDPQTAEEHALFAERMAATGVQAYGAVSTEEAHRQYLAFLAAYSVQLSSKQVHDHFNADGLDVASEVAAFRAYGDENMLRHGAAISVVAEAIAASRTAISDIIASGRSMTQPWEVLRNVPTGITDPSGRVTPLLDWHNRDALKTEAEMLFASGSAMIAGAVPPTMGIVLADDDKAGDEPFRDA